MVFLASCTAIRISMSRSCSSRSASRSSEAARSSTLRFDQAGEAVEGAGHQASLGFAGLRGGCTGVPGEVGPAGPTAFRGDPRQLLRSLRSSPWLFGRSGANRSRGRGIAGCRVPPTAAIFATGSAIRSSSDRLSSASWWTKLELAPFSSSRRTR